MKKKAFTFLCHYKANINYPIFFCFFLLVNILSLISFTATNLPSYFFFPIFLQNTIEALLLLIISEFILKKTTSFGLKIFTSVIFGLALVHLTNFFMLKLLDETLSYLLKFFVLTDLFHIVKVFHAINMNELMMLLIICLIGFIPILGYTLYAGSAYISNKKPLNLSLFQIGSILASTTVALFLFDATNAKQLNHGSFDQYKKNLISRTTFFEPSFPTVEMPAFPLPKKQITKQKPLTQKPNIYIFVIETLRKDFIQPEQAPFLTQISEKYISSLKTFSNANSTQNSWFSIFHSALPFHWEKMRTNKSFEGSVVIQQLHHDGYKIHAFSSSDLTYFDMDQMIFGSNRKYLSSILEEGPNREIQSWEKDLHLINHFEDLITQETYHQGHVFIFFLDATHSEYSFPNTHRKFTPIVDRIDYLNLNTQNLINIKNRYKNAIYYIDSLIERFFSFLENQNLLDEAIVAITGDHGEEFFEEGALFHGTHLNNPQTSVPIILKCPLKDPIEKEKLLTHIDIFPTIFDCLKPNHPILQTLDGKSIFQKNEDILIQGLQNGAKNPTVFRIQDQNLSMTGEFLENCDIYKNPKVKIYNIQPIKTVQEKEEKQRIEELLEKIIKKNP